jgi:hypothetical protein
LALIAAALLLAVSGCGGGRRASPLAATVHLSPVAVPASNHGPVVFARGTGPGGARVSLLLIPLPAPLPAQFHSGPCALVEVQLASISSGGGFGAPCVPNPRPLALLSMSCTAHLQAVVGQAPPGTRSVQLRYLGLPAAGQVLRLPASAGGSLIYAATLPLPRSGSVPLTALDRKGGTLASTTIPAAGCGTQGAARSSPVHFLPGGIRTLIHAQTSQSIGYEIVGERYRFQGHVVFSLEAGTLFLHPKRGAPPYGPSASFNPAETPGPTAVQSTLLCTKNTPQQLIFGLVRPPGARVQVESNGRSRYVMLVAIPATLHTQGRVFATLTTGATTVITRSSTGATLRSESLPAFSAGNCPAGVSVVQSTLTAPTRQP